MIEAIMSILDFFDKSLNALFSLIPRYKPVSPQGMAIQLVAHRGAHDRSGFFIENTEAAFARAMASGCHGIEFDIQTTADGVLVINHDPDLQRLWGFEKYIADIDFQELRQRFPLIPALTEIIERYGRKMHLFIELKAPFKGEEALVQALQGLTPGQDYHLLALEEESFALLNYFPRDALVLVAGHDNTGHFSKLSIDQSYGGVLGHYLLLNNKKMRALRKAGQLAGVGFVDSRFSLYREIKRGHTWLFTNKAVTVAAALADLNRISVKK